MGTALAPILVQASSKCLLSDHHDSDYDAFQSKAACEYDWYLCARPRLHYAEGGIRRLLALQERPRSEQQGVVAFELRDWPF